MRPFSSTLLGGLLLLPCCSALVTTYFRRVDFSTVEFGARLKFDAKLAAARREDVVAHLSEPMNVLSASWPPENILATASPNVYPLRQGPISFAMLLIYRTKQKSFLALVLVMKT